MKFENIFKETEENARLALLSLWTPGKHPMRSAMEKLLETEPLLAEPVFQSTFGWETSTGDAWKSSINDKVWSNLENMRKQKTEAAGKQFKPFIPFKHQAESWTTLKEGKSIVVTSGTGSGKTECFMYPVLSDLYEQGQTHAIEALFLYPLNALMEDQKKRLSEYCHALGLRFAVYNGDTPEHRVNGNEGILPNEVATREEIRDFENNGTRPEILLTNPSMLEYILVRDKDQQMLKESSGKLRWIVIDEAHSYSGSAAVELAYQIKRILDAFGMTAEQVRFACTSATIGDKESTQSLVEFISDIIGQPADRIKVISGKRLVPELDKELLEQKLLENNCTELNADRVLSLRRKINEVAGMTLQQIWEWLCPDKPYDNMHILPALRIIDSLCDMTLDNKPVLSLRAHFFMRTINGLYACANENCKGVNSPFRIYGHLTTYKASTCPDCGAPLLEIVQCKRCQEFILMGSSDPKTHCISSCEDDINNDDYFALDSDDGQDENDETVGTASANTFFLIPYKKEKFYNPVSKAFYETVDIIHTDDNVLLNVNADNKGKWVEVRNDDGHAYCPGCGRSVKGNRLNLKYFRIPISFINQTISPALLRECAPEGKEWGKYIAFTDSRQGTAISAKTFNITVERNQCNARALERLAERQKKFNYPPNIEEQIMSNPDLKNFFENNILTPAKEIPLDKFSEAIFDNLLYDHLTSTDGAKNKPAYKAALIRGTIGRRPAYETSAETMGLIQLVYPRLDNIRMPDILADYAEKHNLPLKDKDWQDFLKIAIDFTLRMRNHIQPLADDERKYIRDNNLSTPIASSDDCRERLKRWPTVKVNDKGIAAASQPRLILQLCAGLGIHNITALQDSINFINKIINNAWNTLIEKKILKKVNLDDTDGYNNPRYYPDNRYVGCYFLDLSGTEDNETARVKRLEKGWLCPVTNQILDTTFCGYSPLIVGEICEPLFEKYRCSDDSIEMPSRPVENDEVQDWLIHDKVVAKMKSANLWSDRHKYVYKSTSAYIAAEHSAQQSKELLKKYTKNFSDPNYSINVLHCSTTMEMGVDIGDIDIVLMDTIPPAAANYLQRVGRAGRMGQSKSLAFSLCNNTPVGQYVFAHPMWALQTSSHMIKVRPSQTIIQRHINSYLFRNFICRRGAGIQTTISIDEFVASDCDAFIQYLDDIISNRTEKSKFKKVFGNDIPFAPYKTKESISKIKKEYEEAINELNNAFSQFNKDIKRQIAISNQIRKVKNEGLLNYLSEHQFIPNASMPTGVVSFDFTDKDQASRLNSLYKDVESVSRQIKTEPDSPERNLLQNKLNKLKKEIDSIHRATSASRDIHTALNEYAPEQTVVVNEKNYISAGISLFGAYNEETQTRAIYHCTHCGHTDYRKSLTEGLRCPICNSAYHSIIDRNNSSFTLAYEPAGFRTDQHVDSSREEKTSKRFYDIRPVLLKTDWTRHIDINMCEVTVSDESGNILFYNTGDGNGFAFCKRCGRASVEYSDSISADSIPLLVKPGHNRLWGDKCDANEHDIARHVVFTGLHPTCYSVFRFKTDAGSSEYENDKQLVYSLGVVLTRALAASEGIDETEIDFGIKQERDAWLLFIYDTAKGGCGYSLRFTDPAHCQEIFDIARKTLKGTDCKCQINGGACAKCLIDRNNFKYAHLLSKAKVMDWLDRQKILAFDVPDAIKQLSPSAKAVYQPLKEIVKRAVNDPEVKNITLCVSDTTDDYAITDWSSIKSEMGRQINLAVEKGKNVYIAVEYHPDLHVDMADKLPFINLKDKFPDCNVMFVQDMGILKTAVIIETSDRTVRYFTDEHDGLTFSDNWGSCHHVFTDSTTVLFSLQDEPAYKISSSQIIREGLTQVKIFNVGNYFSKAILPFILKDEDHILIKKMLGNKNVVITFSDMYMNSALSSLMLVYLIYEMKRMYNFSIDKVSLHLNSKKRKCQNETFNDWTYIGMNFHDKDMADKYTNELFKRVLDIAPQFTGHNTDHHRWLKIENNEGSYIEIRPDHGISGGYKSNSRYMNIESLNGSVQVYKNDEDVLYYIIINNV